MYYRMTVAGLERDLPICPLNEKLSIAGFVIFIIHHRAEKSIYKLFAGK